MSGRNGPRVLDGLGWRHAVVPAAIVALATIIVAIATGAGAVAAAVGPAFLACGLTLLAVLPGAGLALIGHRHRNAAALALAVVAGLLVVNTVSLTLPRVGPFAGLDWNWQGKTLDLVWMLALVALLSPGLRREIGWTWKTDPGTLGPALTNILIWGAIGFAVTRMGMFGDPVALAATDLTLERVLFDTTHPNLVEEIVFRGFMMALLDRAFRPQWTVLGAKIGWGVVLTAWLFGMAHGIGVDASGAVSFDPVWLGQTFAVGLVLGWVRALTGSLWPAFLGHCAPEIGILLALASVAWF